MLIPIDTLRRDLEAVADAVAAAPMAAYMKHRFDFMGIKSPERRRATKETMAHAREARGDELVAFAHACWNEPEREFQYVGVDVLSTNIARLESRHLADIEELVTTKSWWDTVDGLAAWCVGGLVRVDRALTSETDRWIDGDDVWLARSAILHQLRWGADTDADRLFDYALRRAGDSEFFIRKAIGWALRQYARIDPEAVRVFVTTHEFSGLTRREALRHL
jgi:3-methyladenine DNA glycosylase AlkD